MTKVLTFNVEGDIRLDIGDPSYYNELGLSKYPNFTHEKTYEYVKGNVYVHMDKNNVCPMAHILLTKEELPQSRAISFKLEKDFGSLGIVYFGDELTEESKELGCDTAGYEINGAPVDTGSDGSYGCVTEYRVDGFLAGVSIDLYGPMYKGSSVEDFYQTIKAALEKWVTN